MEEVKQVVREGYVAEIYHEVQGEMNSALRDLHTVGCASAALSFGTGDHTESEKSYLDAVLTTLRSAAAGDNEKGVFLEVGIEVR